MIRSVKPIEKDFEVGDGEGNVLVWNDVSGGSENYNTLIDWVQSLNFELENLGKSQDGDYDLYGIETGNKNRPTIMIVANLHGWERGGTHTAIEFLRRVRDRDFEYKPNNSLGTRFHYYLIVSANPWGYESGSRQNSRGIDLNRNFDYNWVSTGEGTEPFSEAETVIVRDKIQEIKPICVVDVHNWGGFSWSSCINARSNPSFDVFTEKLMRGFNLSTGKDLRRYHASYNMAMLPNWAGTQINRQNTHILAWLYEIRNRLQDDPPEAYPHVQKCIEAINFYVDLSFLLDDWFKRRKLN